MPIIAREQIRPYRTNKANFTVLPYAEATSQSVLSGTRFAQVVDLTSGRVRKANATAPGSTLAASTTVLGVMADPFTNRSATSDLVADRLGVYVADSSTTFKVHVVAGTGPNGTVTAALVGGVYGLIALSNGSGNSGFWSLNTSQTSNTYVRVVGLIDAVNDTNGAVEVVFENDKIVFGD